MTDERKLEISYEIARFIVFARTINLDELIEYTNDVVREVEHLDSVGCLLDPSNYKTNRQKLIAAANVTRAWTDFVNTVQQNAKTDEKN